MSDQLTPAEVARVVAHRNRHRCSINEARTVLFGTIARLDALERPATGQEKEEEHVRGLWRAKYEVCPSCRLSTAEL